MSGAVMRDEIKKIVDELSNHSGTDDFLYECEDAVEKLEKLDITASELDSVFRLFETYQDEDFGLPGALTRYLESFFLNGYEEQLIKSLKRKPTKHTLWMLNRLINGLKAESRLEMIDIMRDISHDSSIDPSVRDDALEFLAFQKESVTKSV